MNSEIILDVSLLPPPLPMEMAMDAMEKIEPGQYIKMIHRMQPHPLYTLLFENGYKYKTLPKEELFEIYIWKAVDKVAEQLVKDTLPH